MSDLGVLAVALKGPQIIWREAAQGGAFKRDRKCVVHARAESVFNFGVRSASACSHTFVDRQLELMTRVRPLFRTLPSPR